MTVGIVYGFAEGPQVGKRFGETLQVRGYELITNLDEADVIVAHSAGCYFLPETSKRQLILLIGPPYWPGRSLLSCMVQKIIMDFKDSLQKNCLGYWLRKTFWNWIYIFKDLPRAGKMSLYARRHNFYKSLRADRIILIRNTNEAWCSPDITNIIPQKDLWKYVELPGQHDDCWFNPGPYIDLLQSVA